MGCILGHAVGDAVGAPFEGVPATAIWYEFGGSQKVVAEPPVEELCYTDDTQMGIGVAETLVLEGRIVEATLMQRFAANYDPKRGYGPGARRILEAAGRGEDSGELARTIFPGGSLGNGAGMRAHPVGLVFHEDLDRVVAEARLSALPTHVHPVGIEGAQLIALSVAMAIEMETFDRARFYAELIRRAQTETFQRQLNRAAELGADEGIGQFGCALEADRSVVTAIAAFAESPMSYEGVVSSAIALGGDVDTVAAMGGAMSGALLGVSAIPKKLIGMLEDGQKGRSYLRELGETLYVVHESLD